MAAQLIEVTGEQPPGSGASKEEVSGRRGRRPLTAWPLLLAPALVALLGLTIWPLGRTLYLSFTDLDGSGVETWVGFRNYLTLFTDPLYLHSLGVSATYVVVGGTIELVLGFGLALLLSRKVSAIGRTLRVIFAIPMMLSPVVVGVTWKTLLDPHFGWVNAIIGQPGMDWLGDPSRALWVLIAVDVWQWTPYMFMLLTAGLLSVPADIYEAAAIDGAGKIKTFLYVTLPIMVPVVIISTLLRTIEAAKTFDLPYALTAGGPGNVTETVGMFIYRTAFSDFDQGYASALSIVTSIALLLYVLVFLRGLRFTERKLES